MRLSALSHSQKKHGNFGEMAQWLGSDVVVFWGFLDVCVVLKSEGVDCQDKWVCPSYLRTHWSTRWLMFHLHMLGNCTRIKHRQDSFINSTIYIYMQTHGCLEIRYLIFWMFNNTCPIFSLYISLIISKYTPFSDKPIYHIFGWCWLYISWNFLLNIPIFTSVNPCNSPFSLANPSQ